MIVLSVRKLHEGFYDRDVVESAVRWGYRVDPSLVQRDEDEDGGRRGGEKRGGAWVIVASGSSGEGVGDGDGNKERIVGTNSDGNGEMEEEREVIVAVGAILFPSPSTNSLPHPPSSPTQPHPVARLKALFTQPSFTRLGLASTILSHCENEVQKAGYERLEFKATVCLFSTTLLEPSEV